MQAYRPLSSVHLAGGVLFHLGTGSIRIRRAFAVQQFSITLRGCIVHHTVAWRVSTADNGAATDITPVQDDQIAISNAHFLPQAQMNMIYAYYGGAVALRARFITPNWRQVSTPWIRPINLAIVPLDEPNVADYSTNPLVIKGLEELQLEGYQGVGGGAAVTVGVAGLATGPISPSPQADIIPMRGTGTTTAVAGSWTSCPITWQDTLPNARFAVMGLEAIGVTCIAARLIFEEGWMRPGCIGQGLTSGNTHPMFRYGRLGVWGTFNAYRLPIVQFLCNAADTAQEVFLHLARIG